MKFKVGATVPVVQYGNLSPELEIEADTVDEAWATALPQLQKMWNAVCEPGRELQIRDTLNRQKIQAFVGGEVYYDDSTHTYTNEAGDKYMSGSEWAKQFDKPFDIDAISESFGNSKGIDPRDIKAMWNLNSEVSRSFGDAIHKALELYGKYINLSTSIEKEYHINKHPVIRQAVESFYEKFPGEYEHEIVVVDHDAKRAGRIDLLQVTGAKKCRVQDFKTNHDIDKKLDAYWAQLTFYGGILEAHGWEVEGLDIYHYDGTWNLISSEGMVDALK